MVAAKSKIKQVSVLLRPELINYMNYEITAKGLYSDKPDMIVSAMRKFYEFNLSVLTSHTKRLDEMRQESGSSVDINYMSGICNYIHEIVPDLTAFKSVSKESLDPVVIRIPLNFYNLVLDFNKQTGFYNNIQEFIRYSIRYQMMTDGVNDAIIKAVINHDRDLVSSYGDRDARDVWNELHEINNISKDSSDWLSPKE